MADNAGNGETRTTELIHLSYDGNFQLECQAKVIGITRLVDSSFEVQLDRTTMHPQGGGQPTDVGTMTLGDKRMFISRVIMHRESGKILHHIDKVNDEEDQLSVGDSVLISVDATNRGILSECHTAGHVVDSAMARCGKVLPPSKGYHFLDGPYVEYKGQIPPDERVSLLGKLQSAFADLVEEDIATKIETFSKEEAERVCYRIQQNFLDWNEFGKGDIRIVTVAGWACPCGGTHVRSTADLKERKWGIIGIKSKKGVVRVKYGPNAV